MSEEIMIPMAEIVEIDDYYDNFLFNLTMSVEDLRLNLNIGANPIIMKDGQPLLTFIIVNSKVDVLLDKVKVIMDDERTDMNRCDKYGLSPLHRIINRTIIKRKESLEVLNYILKDKRTKVNIKTESDGMTELIYCVFYFNILNCVRVDIERLLEDKRISVNLRDKYDTSVLDYLFQKFNYLNERKEGLKLLIWGNELNLNRQDSNGNTLLMRLLQKRIDYLELKEIIYLILNDKRTNFSIKNKEGKTVEKLTEDKDIINLISKLE